MSELGIKRGNFGETYQIIVKNVDYGGYDANIYVKSSGGTMLLDGVACDSVTTEQDLKGNTNTVVEFTPASGMFGSPASTVDYLVEITFSSAGFRNSTKTFNWQVYDELR